MWGVFMDLIDILIILSSILLSHFIVTAWIYANVKREDKGLDPKPENFFSRHIFPAIMLCPMILHEIFEYTFGFFSRLLRERVSNKGVRAEDEISRLRKENERLISERKESINQWLHITEVINESEGLNGSNFHIKTYSDFLTWYYRFRKN